MQCTHKDPGRSISALQSPEFEFPRETCVTFSYLILSPEMELTVDVTRVDSGNTSTTPVHAARFTWHTEKIYLPVGERFRMIFKVASTGEQLRSSRIVKIDRVVIGFDLQCIGM